MKQLEHGPEPRRTTTLAAAGGAAVALLAMALTATAWTAQPERASSGIGAATTAACEPGAGGAGTGGSDREGDSSAAQPDWDPPKTFHVSTSGPANCNCTEDDAQLTVCHQSTVTVEIGTNEVSISTGQSEGSCASQTVPEGVCIYYQYNFACTTGFFGNLDCSLVSTALKSRPTNERDCIEAD